MIFPTRKIAVGKNWGQPGQQIHLHAPVDVSALSLEITQKFLVAAFLRSS